MTSVTVQNHEKHGSKVVNKWTMWSHLCYGVG